MIQITIPGFADLRLQYLVSDYNGTLALDGRLLPGVSEMLKLLAADLEIHVVTADTFGLAASQLVGLPVRLTVTTVESQAETKQAYVERLGAGRVVALGNGRNDRRMLEVAAVGIALIQAEGAAAETLRAADVVSTDVLAAFDLLRNPQRLIATLRS